MLTRHMRNKEEKRKNFFKKMVVKICVPKFRNPCINYKLSESVYVSESKLMNPDDGSSFFDALFDYNRIITCSSFYSMIKCQLQPYIPSRAPLPYFLQRIKSFGDKDLFEFSNKIEQVCLQRTDEMVLQRAIELPTAEQLARQYSEDMCVILMRDLTPLCSTFNQFIVSKKLIEQLGFSEEKSMLAAAKFGCLGNGESTNLDIITSDYSRQLRLYLQTHLEYNKALESNNLSALSNVFKESHVETTYRTINNNKEPVDWKCVFKVPCPNAIVIKFQFIEPPKGIISDTIDVSASPSAIDVDNQLIQTIQEEEYSILKHLVKVPQNFLKINKNYVCKFKHSN